MDDELLVRIDLLAGSTALETQLLQNLGHDAIVRAHAADLVTDHALKLATRNRASVFLFLLGKAIKTIPAADRVTLFASEKVFLHDHAGGAFEVGLKVLDHVATVNVDLVKRHDWALV